MLQTLLSVAAMEVRILRGEQQHFTCACRNIDRHNICYSVCNHCNSLAEKQNMFCLERYQPNGAKKLYVLENTRRVATLVHTEVKAFEAPRS